MTEAQVLLAVHLAELGFTARPEYRFTLDRKWLFDLAVPDVRLAFEIEGGAWTRGRHTRGKGFIADIEKYNTATLLGWRVLRCTPEQVLKGEFKVWLSEHLARS
jgi:hypothetical protein